jgi:hypothetical protein
MKEQTPIGYLFNGRFYKTIEDLRGKTMSEDNHPQPLFTESQCNTKVLEALEKVTGQIKHLPMSDLPKHLFAEVIHDIGTEVTKQK